MNGSRFAKETQLLIMSLSLPLENQLKDKLNKRKVYKSLMKVLDISL